MKNLNILLGLVCLIFVFQSFNSPSHIQSEVPPIILILDGSGSMWGQVDGITKIEIARDVVAEMLSDLDPTRPIGLVAYGHRQKGDCQDIEELVAPGLGNHDVINAKLEAINPTGKTPLANTAIKVIDQLKASGESATIILVSDGAESCGGDLCEVIRKAKEAGVDFVLHIVGFDIGESDKLALECAAREGEGVYLDAGNAEQLSAALEQATEMTVEKPVGIFGVKVQKDGELHDAAIKIYPQGDSKPITSSRSYANEKTNPAMFNLLPGQYDVEVIPLGTNVHAMWERNIEVKEAGPDTIEFDFTAGEVSILTTSNGDLWDCTVAIYPAGVSTGRSAGGRTYRSENHNPMIKELTPGRYDIYVEALGIKAGENEKVFRDVEIKPGERTEISQSYPRGEISILATNNAELWDCVINITQPPSNKSVGGGRTYSSSNSNPKTQTFSPGTYAVEYKAHKINGAGNTHIVENVEVRQGEKTEIEHHFESGTLRIGVTYKGDPWDSSVYITQPPSKQSVASARTYARGPSNHKEFIVTPGTYQIEVKPLKLEAPAQKVMIEVKAGDVVEKTIEFN